jgi:hypothetical protein
MEVLDLKRGSVSGEAPEAPIQAGDGDIARMRRIMGDRFVEHAYASRVLDAAELLLTHPSSRDLLGMLLAGSLGMGRSMLAEAITRRFPFKPATGFEYPQVPVIRFSLTGARDPHTLCTRVLDAFGDKYEMRGRGDPERRVLRRMSETRTRLLIADNVHEIHSLGEDKAKEILKALQYIVEEGPRRAIYVTEPELVGWLAKNDFINVNFSFHELPTWTFDDAYTGMLELLERALPLRKQSKLQGMPIAQHLLKLSGGNTGRLMRIVKNAGVLAIHNRSEVISKDTLDAATQPLPVEVVKKLSADAAQAGHR